jgi:hypothetical protein
MRRSPAEALPAIVDVALHAFDMTATLVLGRPLNRVTKQQIGEIFSLNLAVHSTSGRDLAALTTARVCALICSDFPFAGPSDVAMLQDECAPAVIHAFEMWRAW